MQKRSLIIGFSLVLLSAVAAVSSTLAWFTTSKTATIKFTDATIRNRSANLLVEYIDSLNTMVASEDVDIFGDTKIDLTVDAAKAEAKYVTDVSGDGITFNKLTWSSERNHSNNRFEGISYYKAGEINDVDLDVKGDADAYLIDFTLRVKRDNIAADHGLLVYLGEGTRILPKIEDHRTFTDTLDEDGNVIATAHNNYVSQQLKNINATKATRLAVNSVDFANGDIKNHETILVYTQKEENVNYDPQYMYIEKDKAGLGMAYGLGGYNLIEQEEVRVGDIKEIYTPSNALGRLVTVEGDELITPPRYFDFTSGFKYYQNKAQVDQIVVGDNGLPLENWEQPANYGLIADLNANDRTEAYLNFRLWVEGTDWDAMSDVIGGVFTLELDIFTVEVLKD